MSSAPDRYPDVLILGAGFSKAVSATMPLTDDLGSELAADLRKRQPHERLPGRFQSGHFEAWLSRLAEDQPDLSATENFANRYLFAQCSDLLAHRLEHHVALATEDPDGQFQEPDGGWLARLVGTLHTRQATVITFNQDTLVELAMREADLHCWDARRWSHLGGQPRVPWWDILDSQPPLSPGRWASRAVPQLTCRLLKLHGSTNWYWTPGDITGGSVASWFLPGDLSPEQAIPDEAAARERELPGRVPLIVPPAAGKSGFYRAPTLAQLWQNARRALAQPAARVSIVGYSLPVTDLSTAGMLRETIGASRPDGVPPLVEVVNPDPDPVVANLQTLGIEPADVTVMRSVAEFAQHYERRAATDALTALTRSDVAADRSLLAGTSITGGRKVVAVRGSYGDVLQLTLEAATHRTPAPTSVRAVPPRRCMSATCDRPPQPPEPTASNLSPEGSRRARWSESPSMRRHSARATGNGSS